MTIGKKFLERVLGESQQLTEAAKKDVDGFRDNFDIPDLPASSPLMVGVPLPLARQVIQMYHLLGVSVESLESRPKAVKTAAASIADQMRTNRPLRIAAQRLFTALATAKGYARAALEEADELEPTAAKFKGKDITLLGGRVVKQIEEVLAAMGLPSSVLQRSMRRDSSVFMDTAQLLMRGAVRSKFMMFAQELGVNLTDVQSKVHVDEAFEPETTFVPGKAWNAKTHWAKLRHMPQFEWDIEGDAENPDHVVLTVMNANKSALAQAMKFVDAGVLRVTAGPAGRERSSARRVGEAFELQELSSEQQQTAMQRLGKRSMDYNLLTQLVSALGLEHVFNLRDMQDVAKQHIKFTPAQKSAINRFLQISKTGDQQQAGARGTQPTQGTV